MWPAHFEFGELRMWFVIGLMLFCFLLAPLPLVTTRAESEAIGCGCPQAWDTWDSTAKGAGSSELAQGVSSGPVFLVAFESLIGFVTFVWTCVIWLGILPV